MEHTSTATVRHRYSTLTPQSVEQLKVVPPQLAKRNKQVDWINQELETQIAERLQAEKALRQAEEKYRSIFENAVEGIFQTTPIRILLKRKSSSGPYLRL